MIVLEIAAFVVFFFGAFYGLEFVLRPGSPPNCDRWFKRRYHRTEWNERNPEDFTRRVGAVVLGATIVFFFAVILPIFLSLLETVPTR